MHNLATARPVSAAFGVFWNYRGRPVPCEAYTIDANGKVIPSNADLLAGAYSRGETFLTYEGRINEDAAKKSIAFSLPTGLYSVRSLPAGTFFYDDETLCVVAPAEPAALEPTPGPWHASSTHSGCAFDIGAANGANVALVSGPSENGADEFKANARLIAAMPDLLSAAKAALFVLRIVNQREPGTNETGAISALEAALLKAGAR